MANVKWTEFPSGTPVGTDLIPFVSDPGGTPENQTTTFADLPGTEVYVEDPEDPGTYVLAPLYIGETDPAIGGDDPYAWLDPSELGGASSPPHIDNLTDFNAIFGTGYTAHDYEFNATSSSLPSGWSWVNQGSATYDERFGGGAIQYPAVASINWRMLMQSVTGLPSTWTLTAKMTDHGNATTDCFSGLTFYDGTKVVDFSRYASLGKFYVDQWTNVTTYSSSPLNGVQRGPFTVPTYYLRITKNSGTSYDFAVSADGVAWITLLAAYNLSAYMTATYIGFGMSNTANLASAVTCQWFRVR